MVRWVYVARIAIASAIFIAAVFRWGDAPPVDTLVASLAFAVAFVFTAGSLVYSEVQSKPLGTQFLYLQTLADLALVTAVVHVTGGNESGFVALYILVIASAVLLLPIGGGLLIAALANAVYFADVLWAHSTTMNAGVLLQLAVFGVVALGTGAITGRLRAAGVGREELGAELVRVRLEAADILRNIRSGILTVDSRGRLMYANPAASQILGFDLQESLGRQVLSLIGAVAPSLSIALARTAHAREKITRVEGELTLNGRVIPIGVTTTYADPDEASGSDLTATAIFQDISDQKKAEVLHLRAERLEAIAELSASLAHEIRNPLSSIRSAVEQLGRMPAAGEDEKTLSGLIVRESDRLARLLGEFLDFARVRVTRIDRLDLAAVARGAANLAATHPDRAEKVRVECITPEAPIYIEGDEDLLHRAVFNLTLNAVQALSVMGSGEGVVRIEVGPVNPEQVPNEIQFGSEGAALRVSDNGPGIPEEVRDRLFEPFITTKSGGSGLGLPVVHRAVEAHRGVVLVDSDTSGTRFTVLLPYRQSETGVPE
jgi:two-component system, NtrC family, sensor histidine kinase PilS